MRLAAGPGRVDRRALLTAVFMPRHLDGLAVCGTVNANGVYMVTRSVWKRCTYTQREKR